MSYDDNVRRMARAEELGDLLVRDDEIDFGRYQATPADRAKVRPAASWCDQVIDHFSAPAELQGAFLPWRRVQNEIRLRPGELSIWTGINGHGKSLILSQIMLCLARQGEKVCIASLEMKPVATMARMARQALGTLEPGPLETREFHQMLRGQLWLYDQQGTVRPSRMFGVMRYCREELGIGHLVIDSLMKCGLAEDDYNGQKDFVDVLSTYAKDSGLHVHLVAHSKKLDDERTAPGKFDVKGSGTITDMADNVFATWRNKAKETAMARDDKSAEEVRHHPDAMLRCDKQRNGDWEGSLKLWFVKHALQYVAKNSQQTIDYMRWTPGGFEE